MWVSRLVRTYEMGCCFPAMHVVQTRLWTSIAGTPVVILFIVRSWSFLALLCPNLDAIGSKRMRGVCCDGVYFNLLNLRIWCHMARLDLPDTKHYHESRMLWPTCNESLYSNNIIIVRVWKDHHDRCLCRVSMGIATRAGHHLFQHLGHNILNLGKWTIGLPKGQVDRICCTVWKQVSKGFLS